jgi:hypothetical protein
VTHSLKRGSCFSLIFSIGAGCVIGSHYFMTVTQRAFYVETQIPTVKINSKKSFPRIISGKLRNTSEQGG